MKMSKLVEKNLELSFEFMRYLLAHPELAPGRAERGIDPLPFLFFVFLVADAALLTDANHGHII
jgi:hypothetical protein